MRAQYAPDGNPPAEYKTIWFTNDESLTISVPMDPENADYRNIMQLVAEGKLTIELVGG